MNPIKHSLSIAADEDLTNTKDILYSIEDIDTSGGAYPTKYSFSMGGNITDILTRIEHI